MTWHLANERAILIYRYFKRHYTNYIRYIMPKCYDIINTEII